jgi:hypothetical protein
MSSEAYPEQELIIAKAISDVALAGGRAYDEIPEEQDLEKDADGILILPYIVVAFGTLIPQEDSRSIEGYDQQPLIMPIIWECWAPTKRQARQLAGQVRTAFRGWQPNENSTQIEMSGGSWADPRNGAARPSRYLEAVTAQTVINQAVEV